MLGKSTFYNREKTVEPNRLFGSNRNKKLPFAVAAWTSNLFFTFTKLWMCLVHKWSCYGTGKLFLKVGEKSGQNVRP